MSVQFKLIGKDFFDSYNDEPVTYTRKSLDFQKVDLTYSDSSQAFTLPATAKNEGLFQHYSDVNVTNGYNPFSENPCEMWINNELYSTGKLSLISIKNAMNKPVSYSVQFFSDVINLKDSLADKGLNSLDWIDQRHSLTKDDARNYLAGGAVGVTNLLYPMASTSNYWSWTGTTQENTRQIESTQDGILNRELRPAIPIEDVMQKIFDTAGFEFEVDFGAQDYYTKLYMWIHNSKEMDAVQQIVKYRSSGVATELYLTEQTIIWSNKQVDELNLYNAITGVTTIALGGIAYSLTINFANSSSNGQNANFLYRWVLNGVPSAWQGGAPGDITTSLGILTTGDEVYIEMKKASTFNAFLAGSASFEIKNTSPSAVDFMEVSRYMPDMKCIDFIKGILVMFNAVMFWNSKDKKFVIQHRSDWFAAGDDVDISDNIDISNNTLKPPTFYKTYGFEFEEGEDLLNENYLNSNGRGYGSAFFDTGNYFGDEYKAKCPFTSNIWGEVLIGNSSGVITGVTDLANFASIDSSLAPVDPGVRLMYFNGTHANTAGLYAVADIYGNKSIGANDYNLFLNNLQASNVNLAFNSEFDFKYQNPTVINDNLYTNFYQDYISSIYNPNVRRKEVTAYIPYNKLKTIKLNDTLIIDGVKYIIDSMKIDLLKSKAVFNIINKI